MDQEQDHSRASKREGTLFCTTVVKVQIPWEGEDRELEPLCLKSEHSDRLCWLFMERILEDWWEGR